MRFETWKLGKVGKGEGWRVFISGVGGGKGWEEVGGGSGGGSGGKWGEVGEVGVCQRKHVQVPTSFCGYHHKRVRLV